MAAVARGTPSFALPATQNTAPVHEYRCLYTHDARKKTKKWHDGSARFHTFNKRVMVYDDTKSFVGDLHYRADEEFGEGIELHLDRGVLVEVGERVGETQTDLTGIVHKSHVDGDISVSSASAQPKPILRAVGLNGQGRPKSLTELLGTSQSRHGRAKLQNTSPFEQRQALLEVQPTEPPPKKQKTMSEKNNDITIERTTIRPQQVQQSFSLSNGYASSATHRSRGQPFTADRITTSSPNGNQCVIDISSDEESQSRRQSVSKKSQNLEFPSVLQQTEDRIHPPRPRTTTNLVSMQGSLQERNQVNQVSKPPSRRSARPASVNIDTSVNSRSRPPMGSLKMTSQKPRRKLMYKALLPPSLVDQTSGETPAMSEALNVVTEGSSGLSRNDDPVPLSSIEVPDQNPELEELLLPTRLSLPSRTTPEAPQRSGIPSETPQLSPLFVSQAESQRSPNPTMMFVEDDFRIPATQESIAIRADPDSPNPIEAEESIDAPKPDSPCFPLPPSRFRKTTQDVSNIMPPPLAPPPSSNHAASVPTPIQRPSSPTRTRVFTRSLSENDSPLSRDPRTAALCPILQPIEESPTNIDQCFSPVPPPQIHHTTPSKSPLQRSRSDTAAIVPKMTSAPTLHAAPDEQGPWTKLEAFLLFEQWPACKAKNKPVFEPLPRLDDVMADEDVDDDDDGIDFMSPITKRPPVLIRSARSVLRDG